MSLLIYTHVTWCVIFVVFRCMSNNVVCLGAGTSKRNMINVMSRGDIYIRVQSRFIKKEEEINMMPKNLLLSVLSTLFFL